MKINVANPQTGLQKQFDIDDGKLLLPFLEKRIGDEIAGDSLGDEFVGSIVQITGGSDMEGFPMMQGVITKTRVRLLFRDKAKKHKAKDYVAAPASKLSLAARVRSLKAAHNCITSNRVKHFNPRKSGQMKRKTVRGCIVGSDLAVLNLILKKSGQISGLTDYNIPRRLGPKRASNIRKLFNLTTQDNVNKFVIKRKFVAKNGKMRQKSPKVQRLTTDERVQRKRRQAALVKKRVEKSALEKENYFNMIKNYKEGKKNITKQN